uniref:Uncharacterized protein LOC111121395 isoform X2 n=1 Tax=Crassostrea virginica TaxID=6565 RepID=A0A8B8CRC3_CRAVI|nr:uncharacterized protein LOC111121395 isoform X2 [Crassostrea virginica]
MARCGRNWTSAEDKYYGTWKIVECVSLAGSVDTSGIEGCKFHLYENNDVSWKVPDGSEIMPFFNSDTYEFVKRIRPALIGRRETDVISLKFFGTCAEHVIEFKVETSDDLMLLTCERCCILQCQKVKSEEMELDSPYSFMPALEEGFFSDLIIRSKSGREFKLHSILLSLAVPSHNWKLSPLNGMPDHVLTTLVHFLYNECLPAGLSEETARDCIKSLTSMPEFNTFTSLCQTFLRNTALRHQIVSLIDDMHSCANKIINLFTCKKPHSKGVMPDDALVANPQKLCYVIKQATREGSVACSKLVVLCDLFARRSGELPQEERHDIIKYAHSRLPVFIKQVQEFFEVFEFQLMLMGPAQKQEIASYILPEIEESMTVFTAFVEEFQTALDTAITTNISEKEKAEKKEKQKKEHVKDVLSKTLKHALHVRELKKLRNMHEAASVKLEMFLKKMHVFSKKTEAEKIPLIVYLLDALKNNEAPLFVDRMQHLALVLEEKYKWKEWKYMFKLSSSKIAWGVHKLRSYKLILARSLQQMVELVNKEEFTATVAALGLWDNKAETVSPDRDTKYARLSSVESLCIPPTSRKSVLAQRALELFKKKENTDMVFEIILIRDIGDIVIDHTHGAPIERQEEERDVEVHQIPAHCVVLAARCNWFSRALLSGMRESIDKKITIHDTNPEIFSMFLEFLYTGHIQMDSLSTDQLTELLTLADRYEVESLGQVCEHILLQHVDTDTALYLLSIADQFQSKTLKDKVLLFLRNHPDLKDGDVFDQLPPHLQTEIEDVIQEGDDVDRGRLETASSSSVEDTEDMIGQMHISSRVSLTSSQSEMCDSNCLSALIIIQTHSRTRLTFFVIFVSSYSSIAPSIKKKSCIEAKERNVTIHQNKMH